MLEKAPEIKKIFDAVMPRKKEQWALVLEGGAMRSIFTAGVLDAIHPELHNKFDYIVGVSAGAACGVSFACDQRRRMQNIFMNYLSDRRFLDFLRIFDGEKSILDLNYAVKNISENIVPLDTSAFAHSKSKTYLTLTDFENGVPAHVEANSENAIDLIAASCSMPLLTHHPAQYNGKAYVDGGLTDPIPVKKAVELGANRIVVVLTTPDGYRQKSRALVTGFLHRIYEQFSPIEHLVQVEHVNYNAAKIFIENFQMADVELFVVAPPEGFRLDFLTRGRSRLTEGYALGYLEGLDLLGHLRKQSILSEDFLHQELKFPFQN